MVVPLLAVAALFFFLRRRRAKRQQGQDRDGTQQYDVKVNPVEMAGDSRGELVGGEKRGEMQGSGAVYYAHELASPQEERAELDGGAIPASGREVKVGEQKL